MASVSETAAQVSGIVFNAGTALGAIDSAAESLRNAEAALEEARMRLAAVQGSAVAQTLLGMNERLHSAVEIVSSAISSLDNARAGIASAADMGIGYVDRLNS